MLGDVRSRRLKQRAIKTGQVKKFVALHSRGVVSDSKFSFIMQSHMNWRSIAGKKIGTVEMLECRERERYAIDNVWDLPFTFFCKLAQAQNS